MIENYRLDKIMGPSGVMAGYILLVFGLITVYFSYTAIPLILLGSIMSFSYWGTRIKYDKKRYQSYLSLFGFIRLGFWLPFEKSDTILIEKFKGKYTSFSRSNRRTDLKVEDFRILLKTSYNNKKLHLAKFQKKEDCEKKAKELMNLISAVKI